MANSHWAYLWPKLFRHQKPRVQLATCLVSITASIFITVSVFNQRSGLLTGGNNWTIGVDEEDGLVVSPFHPKSERNYTFPYCKCVRLGPGITGEEESGGIPSACSDFATSRGPGQKVVSYTYFGDSQSEGVRRKYFSQIRVRAEEVKRLYPDWLMRVYFDTGPDDFEGLVELCDMWCELDNVDFCDAKHLPKPFGDLRNLQPIGKTSHHECTYVRACVRKREKNRQ